MSIVSHQTLSLNPKPTSVMVSLSSTSSLPIITRIRPYHPTSTISSGICDETCPWRHFPSCRQMSWRNVWWCREEPGGLHGKSHGIWNKSKKPKQRNLTDAKRATGLKIGDGYWSEIILRRCWNDPFETVPAPKWCWNKCRFCRGEGECLRMLSVVFLTVGTAALYLRFHTH